MPLQPLEYGPPVNPDYQGAEQLRGALQERQRTFGALAELGGTVREEGHSIEQMMLHQEVSKASAASMERTAQAMNTVENTPYASRTQLEGLFGSKDFAEFWASVPQSVKDGAEKQNKPLPAWMWGRKYFEVETGKAREDAGNLISLEGWRGEWQRTALHEDTSKMDLLDRRILAPQHIQDMTAQQLIDVDKARQNARTPQDFDNVVSMVEHSQFFHPEVRRHQVEETLREKDTYPVQEAIERQDLAGMKAQLDKMRTGEGFENLTQRQRTTLQQHLEHVYTQGASRYAAQDAILKAPKLTGSLKQEPDKDGMVDETAAWTNLQDFIKGNPEAAKAAREEFDGLMRDEKRRFQQVTQARVDRVWNAGYEPETGAFKIDRVASADDLGWLARNTGTTVLPQLERLERGSTNLDLKKSHEQNAKQFLVDLRAKALADPVAFGKMTAADGRSMMLSGKYKDGFNKGDYLTLPERGLKEMQQQQAKGELAWVERTVRGYLASNIYTDKGDENAVLKTKSGPVYTEISTALQEAIRAGSIKRDDFKAVDDFLKHETATIPVEVPEGGVKGFLAGVFGVTEMQAERDARTRALREAQRPAQPAPAKAPSIPTIPSQEDAAFKALPSGAAFYTPEGKLMRKK